MMKKTETNLKQIAYETIKRKIIHCDYMPNDILSEMMLMEEIDASRTPMLIYGKEATTQIENSVPYYSVSKWSSNTKMLLLHFHAP